jgi:hypothetical protein
MHNEVLQANIKSNILHRNNKLGQGMSKAGSSASDVLPQLHSFIDKKRSSPRAHQRCAGTCA